MEAINYLTDAYGKRKAVVIDLDQLKRCRQNGHDVITYLEELEALIDLELRKDEEMIPWETAKQALIQKGSVN